MRSPLPKLLATILLSIFTIAGLSASADTTEPSRVAQPVRTRLHTYAVHRIGHHKGYVVDVRYPQFAGSPTALTARLNRLAKRTVDMNIPTDPAMRGEYVYRCDYRVFLVTPDLVSIDFVFDDNVGAGGRTHHVPFNFQIRRAFKELTLATVFGNRPKLDPLFDFCITALKKQYKDDLSLPSDTAFPSNAFSDFNFNAKGLTFIFAEGYVAAEAIGCPSVLLDYTAIKKLFSRRSPLHQYVLKSESNK